MTTATPAAATTSAGAAGQKCHFDNGVEHCGDDHDDEKPSAKPPASAAGQKCHFHAGVEHCGDDAESADEPRSCGRVDRDYRIGLRVGALFTILVTSSIGVFGPLLIRKLTKLSLEGLIFTMIKQFGTGVLIATAFVHLLTHAELMFNHECMGRLAYESTTTAICMAGVMLSFAIEYMASRLLLKKRQPQLDAPPSSASTDESTHVGKAADNEAVMPMPAPPPKFGQAALSLIVLESGIVFHSILIGLVLVVAGDSFFITLWVIIIFHQMFEGLALGSRIAALPRNEAGSLARWFMAGLFAIITPLGMAIGIGVLKRFNGQDRNTLIALGTLDALSAGILLWVALVDMLAGDWMHGDLRYAGAVKTGLATAALLAGLISMSVLANWA
ncbi:MAG: hypothetical protein M1823_004966 [Watsoniomyces obsoletus]|nr:MAG: hypothetical protein M1823_004966 [Watsoniomyces obsoletus]